MAWHGVPLIRAQTSVLFLIVYWGAFLALLIGAFVMALLDLRYIRVLHALEQRRIFHETIGSPSFRQALRAAHKEAGGPKESGGDNGESPEVQS